MKRIAKRVSNGAVLVFLFLCICVVAGRYVAADVGNVPTGSTQYIDLKTDGTTYTVAYAGRYAFAGGEFKKSELLQSKQFLQNANLVIVDVLRHLFTFRQLRVDGAVTQSSVFGNEVYIAGGFRKIDSQKRMYIALIDATSLEILPTKLDANAVVSVLAPFKSQLVIAGAFTKINIEKFNGLALYDTKTHLFTPWRPRLNGAVTSALVRNSLLIVGGKFTQAEGIARNHVAVYDLTKQMLTAVVVKNAPIPSSFIDSGSGVMMIPNTIATPPVLIPNSALTNPRVLTPGVLQTAQTNSSNARIGIGQTYDPLSGKIMVDSSGLGFQVPTLSDILTFAIRAFFAIAGLTALFYMLWGGLNWVMSGGDKDAITAAREKIQSAVVGLILMVVVLSLIWTMEQVVFKRRICLGLTCSVTLPGLLQSE